MKKFVFGNPILNIVFGLALIIVAILGMFVFNWFSDTLNIVIGVLIIVYTLLHFAKERTRYKDSNALLILIVEAIVAITVAVLLMFDQLGITFTLGLVLYMRGLAYLLIMQLLKLRSSFLTFVVFIAILTLGAYIWFGGPNLGELFQWILFAIIIIYGAILLYFGIDMLRQKKSN